MTACVSKSTVSAMIVCPLCEHQQNQGTVCEVCDRVLVVPQPTGVITEMLADLECTSLPGGAASVAVERMAELDEHRIAAVQIVVPENMVDFERTRHADAGVALPAEAVPGIEPTRFEDDGQRTTVSATRTCRYCGNIQQGGVLCERCGLRLPGSEVARPAKKQSGEPQPIPCPACSVLGFAGTRCRGCGAFIRHPVL